ncbi:CarD family transcriptional regulator [Bacillus sp. AGMB 02131]|uniref:CarD family transcriptional regulator n=1 Tax=Peribacillus faecalis TaxID=2772559 RepID=A0A927HD57_9BACI|nr:CarD family transcriptional regulator [Peribacillus faecalis]MBD3110226.1 CarD family transcriptional regulator [Peribacillus faecalis]
MHKIGDLIIYPAHGVCVIDDICEKTVLGETKSYYVLHPLEDAKLSISIPVDNKSIVMFDLMHKDEAEIIINSFKNPGIAWIENSHQRIQEYNEIINTGNRKEISKIVNTLMKKKHETELNGKKMGEQDRKLLSSVQNILFSELAISLETTMDEIKEKASSLMSIQS